VSVSKQRKPGVPYGSGMSNQIILAPDESDNIRDVITFYNAKKHSTGVSKQAAKFKIEFKAFITDFKDEFTSNWTPTQVFGRMDPVYNYQNTQRKLSISFDLPAFDVEEAAWNSTKLNDLVRYCYPTYNQTAQGDLLYGQGINRHIVMPPIIQAEFGNLFTEPGKALLFGFLDGVTIDPDLDAGVFKVNSTAVSSNRLLKPFAGEMVEKIMDKQKEGKPINKQAILNGKGKRSADQMYFFKNYKLSLGFNPIHIHPLGDSLLLDKGSAIFGAFPQGLRSTVISRSPSGVAKETNLQDIYGTDPFK